jgi:Holliday junction resolvase
MILRGLMPNKNYMAGRNLEYAVIEALEAHGFEAFRSAGSHKIDVTAFNKHNNELEVDIHIMYLWVSCKYASARMSVKDKQDFIQRAKACGVLPVEASRQPRKHIVFRDLEHKQELFV